jgi:hypothetical protein
MQQLLLHLLDGHQRRRRNSFAEKKNREGETKCSQNRKSVQKQNRELQKLDLDSYKNEYTHSNKTVGAKPELIR